MDEQNLTQSFNDYIEPSSIPFRFGAPGWYILLVLFILLLTGIAFLVIRSYRRNQYRRQAVIFLTQLQSSTSADALNQKLVYETAIVLKRVAMSKFGRRQVAGLAGDEWIQWLNKQIKKSGIPSFDHSDEKLISDGIYGNKEINMVTVSSFIEKAKNWIRYHHAI